MRRALIAAVTLMLTWLSMPVAPALAASDAKVVVVVGPVGSHNAHYKDDANQIVDEARRWSSNVVKLFTPNAPWSKVKEAAQGASVFVYLGHGNGWPSIYAPYQGQTKDGLGLDPSSGADGSKVVYYGEDYVRRDIRFAPNAVVLLYHLCYASGNTEPGLAVGTFTDSRERVDNYGSGFIGAGARAVIAEGHPAHPVVNYVRQLFTTDRSMESVFRNAPTFHDHVLGPYAAQRTPGLLYLMDPDSGSPSGFYRSIVGDLTLRTTDVVDSGLVPTGRNPSDFVVPGAAEVTAPGGAGLWAHPGPAADPSSTPPETLPAGTRLRVTSEEAPAADGTRILGVKLLGGSLAGYARASALSPRDSADVTAWSLDTSPDWLSPNDDNVSDGLVVAARFSERATGVLKVRNAAGDTVRTITIDDDIARFAWDLRSGGDLIPDGTYTWSLRAADDWGNGAYTASGEFTVDGTPPVSKATSTGTAGGNGWLVSPATVTLTAKDALSGVRAIAWRVNGGDAAVYGDPAVVSANGSVTFEYRAVDRAGVREAWKQLTLKIDTRAPTISLPMSGTEGDAPDTWRSKVTVDPSVKDAASGIAGGRYSIDGDGSSPLGTDPLVVSGDGAHTVTVSATDVAGNRSSITRAFTIDTTAPSIDVPAAGDSVPTVTPNGDGIRETIDLPFTISEAGTARVSIADGDGTVVRTLSVQAAKGDGAASWDGRNGTGAAVPDGRYTATITPRDLAGNAGKPGTVSVDVYAALAGLARTPILFFPQDGDKLATKATASWRLLSPATVTLRVLAEDGSVVRTIFADRAFDAGDASWAWYGRDDAGAFVPRGVYRLVLTATNGSQSATQQTGVRLDAFKVTASADTATRGTALTITAVSAESLAAAPRLVVRQPGLDPWTVTMTHDAGATWTARITPRKGGTAGTIGFTVKAVDTDGGSNATTLRLTLR